MSVKHVFTITLLARGHTAVQMEQRGRLEEWARYRYLLMLNGTLRSIANQNGGPSETWIRIAPKYQPVMDKLRARYPLPPWVKIIDKRFAHHAETLAKEEKWTHIYMTRVDSDDLLSSNVKALVMEQPPKYRTLNFRTGYLYNSITKILTAYHHISPPFYTDIYSREELLAGKYPLRSGGHNSLLPGGLKTLPPLNFCVVCHQGHFQDSSTWAKLRNAAQMRLRNATPDLQFIVNRTLNKLWNNLENFGCPHYEVGCTDKMPYSVFSSPRAIRLGKTPIISRTRYSPAGVHGGTKRTSIPKVVPTRVSGRQKVPSVQNRSSQTPAPRRQKSPLVKKISPRMALSAKAYQQLKTAHHSRTNTKKRLQKGERPKKRLGYRLLRLK